MGKNNRPRTTTTRSISFKPDVIAAVDLLVAANRTDRSTLIGEILEVITGIHTPNSRRVHEYAAQLKKLMEDAAQRGPAKPGRKIIG